MTRAQSLSPRPLVAALVGTAQSTPDAPAMVFGDVRMSYQELLDRSCQVANAMRGLGLSPGDRVATLEDNSAHSLEIVCGLALAGFVRSPMYVQNSTKAHHYLLDLIGAKALVVQADRVEEVVGILDQLPELQHVLVHGGATEKWISYENVVARASAALPHPQVDGNAPHLIRFSAGTTGRSKGILHSERGWAGVGDELAAVSAPMTARDKMVVAGPLSHAASLLVWPGIRAGLTHVVLPRFTAEAFVDAVEKERATLTFLVPTMIQMITQLPGVESRDMSSIRGVMFGGAPAAERTIADGVAVWGEVLYQLYGQSECPSVAGLPAAEREKHPLSVGRPTPGTELRILDDTGTAVPVGELGEVCVRGPGLMLGIWKDPEATRERFTADGFLRTRDIGYVDADGYVFLADRKDDLIISGGFNIWPAEVENALNSHHAVAEAVVVGVPDERWGETVLAVVRLLDGEQTTEDELISWCREQNGPVKKPTRVEFTTDPLPKSPVGKLLRRVVRDGYWQGQAREIAGA